MLRPSAGGSPLPAPVQAKMEHALGHSFANVRVHQGQEAPSIGALAFARGSHLHFAPGQYRPHSAAGQRILAHELAHVVQQREGRVAHPGGAVPINDDARLEAQADAAAARAGQGGGGALSAALGQAAALPVGVGAVQMSDDEDDSPARPGRDQNQSRSRTPLTGDASPRRRAGGRYAGDGADGQASQARGRGFGNPAGLAASSPAAASFSAGTSESSPPVAAAAAGKPPRRAKRSRSSSSSDSGGAERSSGSAELEHELEDTAVAMETGAPVALSARPGAGRPRGAPVPAAAMVAEHDEHDEYDEDDEDDGMDSAGELGGQGRGHAGAGLRHTATGRRASAHPASAARLDGAGVPALKETKYGGARNEKFLYLPEGRVDAAPPGTKGRTSKLYKDSGFAPEKRRYSGHRTAQALRWMSTVMHSHLSEKTKELVPEVQTSYSNGKFIVSSNSNAHNELLRKELAGMSVRKAFHGILESGKMQGKAGKPMFQPRFRRHAAKLNQRLVKSRPSGEYEALGPGFDEEFTVPAAVADEMDGLHAERRIKAHLGAAFKHATTRGTMRPCAVCNQECYGGECGTGDHPEHGGPLWTSGASTRGATVEDAKKKARAGGTYASLTRHGEASHIHFEYDTDSDSEAELEPAGPSAAAAAPSAAGGGWGARGDADDEPAMPRVPRPARKKGRTERVQDPKGKGPATDEESDDKD
ncbi:MAG TPA: DUF4157 domain-containing protein [Longimicrobium sp.]|uniref:eCIS core domain-containing protein n=1 Tax=Longimicrobium sp. TaxID=2029185 RepID=UPI002EDA4134